MTRSDRSNRGRLGSRKSTTGCTTCKIRKVKCDESRPACSRCKSTGRKCDGYQKDVQIFPATLHVSPGALYNAESDEVYSFQFFTERVVPTLSHIVNKVFWRDTIPRLGQTDGIIWDAINAMSQFIHYPQQTYVYGALTISKYQGPPIDDPNHVKALRWYNKSITALRGRLASGQVSPVVARVSCILYICIECLQNNIRDTVSLYHQGIAMARAAKSQSNLECDFDLEETLSSLMRHMSVAHHLPILGRADTTIPEGNRFSALSHLRKEVHLLIQEAYHFCCNVEEIKLVNGKNWMPSLAQRKQSKHIHTKFTWWISIFNTSPSLSLPYLLKGEIELYSVLLLVYSHVSVWLFACLSTFETAYDNFFPTFKSMIEYGRRSIGVSEADSRPGFVFEARIVPTMFFVATRCRHPLIRREAIKVLRSGPEVESTYRADSMAQLAELNIAIEESGSVHGIFNPEPATDDPPPEQNRIFRQEVVELLDESGQLAHYLKFARWQQDADLTWTQKHDVVKINS